MYLPNNGHDVSTFTRSTVRGTRMRAASCMLYVSSVLHVASPFSVKRGGAQDFLSIEWQLGVVCTVDSPSRRFTSRNVTSKIPMKEIMMVHCFIVAPVFAFTLSPDYSKRERMSSEVRIDLYIHRRWIVRNGFSPVEFSRDLLIFL